MIALLLILALSHLGQAATPIPSVYELKDSVSAEDAPNIARFELTFGVDCKMPSLQELEQMLRHHFELGVLLYDADVEEEIDVIVNIDETWKISRVVSYLQKDEGLSCDDISISEAIFVTSALLPDSNEFLAYLHETGFVQEVGHMEETEERRNLASYPEVLDLRQYSTGVKQQGGVNSCGAHSAATVKEIHERMDYGLTEQLSPRFVYANREEPSGMGSLRVFTVLRDYGIPLEKDYPTSMFNSGQNDNPKTISAEVKRKAKMHRVSSITRFVPNGNSESQVKDRLKELINKKGAGVVAISQFTTSGIFSNRCKIYKKQNGERYKTEHMMAVVGYNEHGLIIRNSWGSGWCEGGDLYMSWHDVKKYAHEIDFWQDTSSKSCRNFEDVTGRTCWSLGQRARNPNAFCQGTECSLADAARCCVAKPKTCLNKDSCCSWGTTCYGCPDNGNSQFEWAWNCGTSRRCNGRGSGCRKSPGDCCIYGSDCHGCPWDSEHVFPNVCGSSRRCKVY